MDLSKISYLDRFKQFISKFTDKEINLGTGVSFDSEFKLTRIVDIDEIEEKMATTKCQYSLRTNIGAFEMVGLIKGRTQALYQIRHILTGETINISKRMFDLLFEKENHG